MKGFNMAEKATATVETPIVATPHPSEKMFAADHPELIVAPARKEDGAAKKSAFEDNLETAIETVVEPKVTPKKESKTEQPAEEEVTPSEETPTETEAKPDKVKDDKSNDVTADDEARFKEYAEKNGITEDEAKAEIEEYEAIAKKYDNDPIKIAKAYKNIQSTFDKQKAAETSSQQARLAQQIMAQGAEQFVAKAEKDNAPKWIAEYKKVYPAESASLSDDVILERCRQSAVGKVKDQMGVYQETLKKDSSSKRDQLVKGLPAEDRQYVGEISRILKDLPDIQVIDQNFNFKDVVRWARGDDKSIAKIKKESYDQGFKAAKSGEIVGEIIAKPQGTPRPKVKENRPAEEQLSSWEQKQANQQYASIADEQERYAAYLEVKRSRKPKEK